MENQKKVRKHRLVESHPVMVSVLASFLWLVLCQLFQNIADAICIIAFDAYPRGLGPVGLIVSVPAALFLYKWWFRPEFEGMLKGNLLLGFRLAVFEFIYVLLGEGLDSLVDGAISIKPLSMTILIASFSAGIFEEFAFRGVLISTLMRQWKDLEKFRTAALISGLTFGLIHGMNFFAGADPIQTLFQVLGCIGLGVLLAAAYLRSGSIIPMMFFHTLHDIIAIAFSSAVSNNGIITGEADLGWITWASLALQIGLGVIGWWMLRPEKNSEMKELWNRKWKVQAAPAEESAPAIE